MFPGSQAVAVITSNWCVQVWNLATKTENVPFQIPPEFQLPPGFMAEPPRFSPDGHALAMDGPDSQVRWWSLPTGLEQRHFPGRLAAVLEGTVATMRPDGALALWDAQTGQETLVLRGHRGLVRGIARSPDGRTLATASWDHTARLWDAANGREIGVLRGHKEGLECLDFSPDGRTLATGSYDDTVKLWNVPTQQEMLTLRPRHSDILHLKFAPDGTALITVSITGMVKVWRAPSWAEIEAKEMQAGK